MTDTDTTTEKSVDEMNMKECITAYNEIAARPVKKFSTIRIARQRLQAAIDEKWGGTEEEPTTEKKGKGKKAKEPKAEGEAKKRTGVKGFTHVFALSTGTTTLQSNSIRRSVYEKVAELDKKGKGVTVEAMDEAMGFSTRTYLVKLEKRHHVSAETR